MNAVAATQRAPVAAPHATHKLKLLLKREFWEHKGGFFWAPIVAGAIALTFTILGAIGGSILKARHGHQIHIEDANPAEIAKALGGAGDVALLGGIAIALCVLGFVVFFYALGCLYDDRKDRSVLFWKSLPISDASTVGSKVAWALIIAPLVAVGVGALVGLGMWIIAALTTSINGVPGASGIFTHSHPLKLIAQVISLVPLYALWALPAVGWLMFCSAAARSKPFLWAVMIPILGCALVSFANVVLGMGFDVGPMWYAVAFRGLASVFPGTWLPAVEFANDRNINGPEDIGQVVNAMQHWSLVSSADLWIGVIVGIAMILAAIRLRRWRDDN